MPADGRFRHEALLYAGDDDFAARVGSFVVDGLARDEPVLVLVEARKHRLLRDALGADATRVTFADMTDVGHNPARIIPAWTSFVRDTTREGRRARGVGEPVWPGRSPEELVECHIHESLINRAFAGAAMSLVCPYDVGALDPSAVDEARRNHPHVVGAGGRVTSEEYTLDGAPGPLAAPPRNAARFDYDASQLRALRDFVGVRAEASHVSLRARETLVWVANELATNSIRHGGGAGSLTLWRSGDRVVCEVTDRGWIRDPLVGRVEPAEERESGRGVWLANQLCDLVQIRTTPNGTTVRVHLAG
ncbi:MAG TPA: anti-sigma factor RsbA family regulatory protein [Acidimicrobiia bacterium]|jgi:anti-sigma regulatory factor (Ser/Thr protein kinase)